jgi:hypothetical protein
VSQAPGLSRPQPTAIHEKPSFSGRYWAKALRYNARVYQTYCSRPEMNELVRNEFIPGMRARGMAVDPDLEEYLTGPRYIFDVLEK